MESEASGCTRRKFQSLAVYCGSSAGNNKEYTKAARALGDLMVDKNITLIYGGGRLGLMGEIAKTVANGLGSHRVVGVIPEKLNTVSGERIGELEVAKDMHTRKAMMEKKADAFIAIPGGFGTLEELMEMVTWQMLGEHDKPVGILNVCGYYDLLLAFADHMFNEGFVRPESSRQILLVAETPKGLLAKMEDYTAPPPHAETLKAERDAQDADSL